MYKGLNFLYKGFGPLIVRRLDCLINNDMLKLRYYYLRGKDLCMLQELGKIMR